jgi:site-specific DNA-methyltransferase (adenine-specific)/site-specific DNA-methyltransferase (cytosine-N4-specific)
MSYQELNKIKTRVQKMLKTNRTYNIDCLNGIRLLENNSVNLVVTSPPYAEQRKSYYNGIPEKNYPQWTLRWCNELKNKLTDDGSICINIRPHIKNGIISDYVLKTRLLLRENGWKECEELIWYKPDSLPMGSINRPRRAWESILWFSKSVRPKCNPKANGKSSNRIGFEQTKFKEGNDSYVHNGQNKAKQGIARCNDVIVCGTSKIERGYNHPAMFQIEIPYYIINMMTDENDLIVDPFIGSGTTGRAASKLNRRLVGFELNEEYCNETNNSL